MQNLGCKVKSPQETELELQNSCQFFWDVASSSFGPNGRCKILQAHDQAGTSIVSSSSLRIAQGVRLTSPVSQLLVQSTIMPQHTCYGDGGLLSIMIASKLVLDALAIARTHAARLEVVAAYQLCVQWLSELSSASYLNDNLDFDANDPCSVTLCSRTSGVKAYVAVVQSVICSKPAAGIITARDAKHVSTVIVTAFINALPENSDGSISAPTVRILPLPGWPIDKSFTSPGLFLDLPLSSPLVDLLGDCSSKNLPLALFDVALEPSKAQHVPAAAANDTVGADVQVILNADGPIGWDPQDTEFQALQDLVVTLHAMGVRVIASQKVIHESIQQAALELGILPLQRLSIFHLQSVALLSGAVPLSGTRVKATWNSHFGILGGLDIKRLGHKRFVVLQPPLQSHELPESSRAPLALSRAKPIQMLVLGAASELQSEELKATVESSLKALLWVMREPRVLPGGGCAEALLAEHIRIKARCWPQKLGHLQDQALIHVSTVLEACAAALVPQGPSCGKHEVLEAVRSLSSHITDQLHQAPGSRIEFVGWNSFEEKFTCVAAASQPFVPRASTSVSSAAFLEVSATKFAAIITGLDAACILLKLDACLTQAS